MSVLEEMTRDREASWRSMEGPTGNGFDRELDKTMGALAERGTWETVELEPDETRVLMMAALLMLSEFKYRRIMQHYA